MSRPYDRIIRVIRIMAWMPCLALVACASLATKAERRGGDTVTQWTLIGDHYGNGVANWRTLAIMQMAMHDALNAAHPVYGRWTPASAGEPAADGANPEVAMAAAAAEVLVTLHPEREAETETALATILARPITAIRAAGIDATWEPLIETPPFPEYPSGHATDCYVGSGVLEAAFPELVGPIVYLSSAHMKPLEDSAIPVSPTSFGMGQHAQSGPSQVEGGSERRFPSLLAAAEECATSRIWAGAHFAAAEVESKRLASIIVRRALAKTLEAAVIPAPNSRVAP